MTVPCHFKAPFTIERHRSFSNGSVKNEENPVYSWPMDHAMLLDAFRRMLEQEFDIVGTAADGLELLESAPKLHPDLVVIDLGLPLLSGVDAGRELKKLLPQTKILVVTVNEDAAVAEAGTGSVGVRGTY